jgi:hypothetical protein
MRSVIKVSTLLMILLILLGCSESESMFKRHVLNDATNKIDEINYGKMDCMNCPMYFYFKADNKIATKIINDHKLKEIKEIPSYVNGLNQKINKEVDWWIKNIDLKNVLVYLVFYEHKTEKLEGPVFRVMIADGNNIYFITNGYFNENEYQEATKLFSF